MKKTKYIYVVVVFLLLCLWSNPVWGDISISASVSKKQVPLNESLALSVIVSGGKMSVPEPTLPPVDGFSEGGRSTSTSFSITNNNVTSSKTTTYTLIPQKKGKFTIPPVTLHYKGKKYSTSPIEVAVVDPVQQRRRPGSRPGQRSFPRFGSFFDDDFFIEDFFASRKMQRRLSKDDVFVEMKTDKKEAYVNEQIILTFYFYQTVRLIRGPTYSPPSTIGFWTEDIPVSKGGEYREIKGKRYLVTQLKTALFPISAGTLTIGRASVTGKADLISKTFTLKTEPIKIKVKPLPKTKNASGGTGLVGFFKMKGNIDKREVVAGNPIEWTITVSGRGNIKSITKPIEPDLSMFESYGPEEQEKVSKENLFIEGGKKFKYIFIPREKGEYEIEPFRLSYFDPVRKEYKQLKTKPVKITVLKGKQVLTETGKEIIKSAIERVGDDVNYIKPDMTVLEDYGEPYYKRGSFLFLMVLPLFIIGMVFFYIKREEKLATDIGYARRIRALKKARKTFSQSHALLKNGDDKEFYASIENVLRGYIGDKVNLSPQAVNADIIRERLNGKEGNISEQLQGIFDQCTVVRFAQTSVSVEEMKKTLNEAEQLITLIEKVWRK